MTSPDDVDAAELPNKEPRHTRTLRIPIGLDTIVRHLARKAGISVNEMFVFLVKTGIDDIMRDKEGTN